MKTEVTMHRNTFGEIISQKSKSGFFSATELERVGNKFRAMNGLPLIRLNTYFSNSSNKEFIKELEKNTGKLKLMVEVKETIFGCIPFYFLT